MRARRRGPGERRGAAARRLPRYERSSVARLFLLFTLFPILDLWLLLRLGRALGTEATVLLVVGAGVAGAWLANVEGRRVLREWRSAWAERRLPAEGIVSGMLVLAGALLLVTPGVLSDAVGLLLLFPPTRRVAAAAAGRWLARRLGLPPRRGAGGPRGPPPRDAVVDVTPPTARGGA